jgi:tetratricopeptide (TPR) repeat protein
MQISRHGCACFIAAVSLALPCASPGATNDPSIDRLLSKLPPPEKLITRRGPSDPAFNDPLVKQIVAAAQARNFGQGYALAKTLTQRHPKSALAFSLRGSLASAIGDRKAAAADQRKALAIQPNLSIAHLSLGTLEATQGRFDNAMPHFVRLTKVEPQSPVGWFLASLCAERLGRKNDARHYARRAAELAPRDALAWLQLAHAEKAAGDHGAAAQALDRAAKLLPKTPAVRQRLNAEYRAVGRKPGR